jgi:parvulin-like peptidyl-prolyl isomerase
MRGVVALLLPALAVTLWAGPLQAQQPPRPGTPQPLPAPQGAGVPNGVAATVNGQPITEVAVERGLRRVPPMHHAEARPRIVDFLIDNALVEQYLQQLNIAIDAKELQDKLEQTHNDMKKTVANKPGLTYEKFLEEMMLTEDELKSILTADIRWDKFANQQATEQKLRDYFAANKDMFDGTMVRARHILLTPPAGDTKAREAAKAQLVQFKQQIEAKAAADVAKMPATTDPLAKEQARAKAVEDAFAEVAREKSACPSKKQGGDLDFFPRAGSMVESFAKAAFALKPYQMSDVVETQFGYHLILATDRRPGKDTKFEDVKDEVKEVYCDKLREAVCAQMRPRAKIVITPAAPKP